VSRWAGSMSKEEDGRARSVGGILKLPARARRRRRQTLRGEEGGGDHDEEDEEGAPADKGEAGDGGEAWPMRQGRRRERH